MFGLEEIICCKQDYDYEDEELYSPALFTHNPNFLPTSPYRDAFDDYKSNQESMIEKEHTKYAATHHSDFSIGPMNLHSLLAVAAPVHSMRVTVSMSSMRPPIIYDICHGPDFSDTPLLGKLSVLKDWATAVHGCHAKGVVHGDITPESVDVVDGKGILNQGPPPDRAIPCPCISSNRDVHVRSVRWAAPELFCTDDSNPRPTAMSDVYSFGCLMLQVLTGRVPYCGTKRPEQVVYLKYLGRDPIDAHTPKVADRYATFMRRCWSLEPEKRPTMESVVGFIHNEIQWFASGQNVV